MPRIAVHKNLPPPRAKDPLTNLYPGGLLDYYAKLRIAERLAASRELRCPHCDRLIALEVRAPDDRSPQPQPV